jgi:hypothetical protein
MFFYLFFDLFIPVFIVFVTTLNRFFAYFFNLYIPILVAFASISNILMSGIVYVFGEGNVIRLFYDLHDIVVVRLLEDLSKLFLLLKIIVLEVPYTLSTFGPLAAVLILLYLTLFRKINCKIKNI